MLCFSLYVPDSCPLCPWTLIIPCSASMSFLVIPCSSAPSIPVSAMIENIVAYLRVAEFMILYAFSVVGISGVFGSYL